jgi:galactose mutarotase-like enzyme
MELSSFSWNGVQLLDRAFQFEEPPEGRWQGRGQVLFPAVGRQASAQWEWPPGSGTKRPMALHGFAKDCNFEEVRESCSDAGGATIEAVLSSGCLSAEQSAQYPMDFRLTITATVRGGTLSLRHTVKAGAKDEVPFALGNHITLRFPLLRVPGVAASQLWEAGLLAGTPTHEHRLNPGSLLSGELVVRPELAASGMPLTHPSACNAVLGFESAAGVEMACTLAVVQPHALRVVLQHEFACASLDSLSPASATLAEISRHRHFVLWGEVAKGAAALSTSAPPAVTASGRAALEVDPDAGFICPEPWLTGPDSLNTRRGLPVLAPGKEGTWTVTVTVEDLRAS